MQSWVTRTRSDLAKAQMRAGYLFILPSFVLYTIFVLAPVVVTFVLSFIYYYPIRLGFAPVHWLTSSRTAMMSIIIMDVWKNTGFFMIIFIAALQGVPKTIMDAAIMDAASYWRRFFRIVLPWISPVVFFAIVYASIGALQVYESIVIMTQGGPGDATRSMSIHIVEEAFGSFEIGYAASVSVIMTLVILIITSIQLLASRRWVRY